MKFSFNLEDVKFIKIGYKNTDNKLCNLQAALREITDEELYACAKFDKGIELEIPQEIELNIVCIDGLYKTRTVLLSCEAEESYIYFTIKTPQGMERQQNREYFRVSASYECTYVYEKGSSIMQYSAKTCDISANGVSIILPEFEIPKTDCRLILNINGFDIHVMAHYVRSEEIENGYKVSFSYSGISETDRDFISQMCIKKQLKDKKRTY